MNLEELRGAGNEPGVFTMSVPPTTHVVPSASIIDAAYGWKAEAIRIKVLRGAGAFRDRSCATCADALLEASSGLAATMAEFAERNVTETLARIDELAAGDREAMAG